MTIDSITRLPNLIGVTVIFLIVDRLTKYIHFGTLPTHYTAQKVVELFIEIVVKYQWFLKSIMSDRDNLFLSEFWTHLFSLIGTQLKYSSLYRP